MLGLPVQHVVLVDPARHDAGVIPYALVLVTKLGVNVRDGAHQLAEVTVHLVSAALPLPRDLVHTLCILGRHLHDPVDIHGVDGSDELRSDLLQLTRHRCTPFSVACLPAPSVCLPIRTVKCAQC